MAFGIVYRWCSTLNINEDTYINGRFHPEQSISYKINDAPSADSDQPLHRHDLSRTSVVRAQAFAQADFSHCLVDKQSFRKYISSKTIDIFSSFSTKNICCESSLEAPYRDVYNE